MTNETGLTEVFDRISNQRVHEMQLEPSEALLAAVIIENVKPYNAIVNVINYIDLMVDELDEILSGELSEDVRGNLSDFGTRLHFVMGELDSLL